MRRALVLTFLVPMLAILSCAREERLKPRSRFAPAPEVQLPEDIRWAFAVDNLGDTQPGRDRVEVGIRRDALEKEFLLQVSAVVQQPVPMWQGQKSRVVAFRQRGSDLYLLEATKGHTLSTELPQALLLAKFPISRETDTHTYFDFNTGMAQIYVTGEWQASDFQPGYRPSWEYAAVRTSFLEDAAVEGPNMLTIRQIAQLEKGGETLEMRYHISPYDPSPNFSPTAAPDNFDRFGYFEAFPLLSENAFKPSVYATKFNRNRPVVFAISANTPAEHRQAIRAGVLYWNRVLGQEILQVIDAPDDVSAPSYDFNVIQWLSVDGLGFAYADAQIDPRSGETLHAQVFFPSTFSFITRAQMRRLLRQMAAGVPEAGQPLVGVEHFASEPVCALQLKDILSSPAIHEILESADDEAIKRLSNDITALVIAHEVGHTLGLRHNFAGSLGASVSAAELDAQFLEYVRSGVVPGDAVASSSVMDYLRLSDEALIGNRIRTGDIALEYDSLAMQHLYFDQAWPGQAPLFCTDSHLRNGEFSDCQLFDVGRSAVENVKASAGSALDRLPNSLMERFIMAKADGQGLAELNLPPMATSAMILLPWASMLRDLTTDGKLLRVWRSFPSVGALNEAEVQAARLTQLGVDLDNLGGLEPAFPLITADAAQAYEQRFGELLASPAYLAGVGPDGRSYVFTADDIEVMRGLGRRFFQRFVTDTNALMVQILSAQKNTLDGELGAKLIARIQVLAHEVLHKTDGVDAVDIPSGDATVRVELPRPVYPLATRKLAANLLNASHGAAINWARVESRAARDAYKQFISDTLKTPFEELNADKLPPVAAKWLLEAQAVFVGF